MKSYEKINQLFSNGWGIILFLLFIIFQHSLVSGEQININGRVTTYEPEPVRYALMAFICNTDIFISITDEDGYYRINTESGIDERDKTIPTTVELFQNYPR